MVQPGIKQDSSSPTPITNMASTTSTKLHNAYKGRVSAKQLSETIDDFLRRLPPATTDATPEIPWIYVANPYIPRDDKGGEEAPAEPGAQLQTFIEGGGRGWSCLGISCAPSRTRAEEAAPATPWQERSRGRGMHA